MVLEVELLACEGWKGGSAPRKAEGANRVRVARHPLARIVALQTVVGI